MSNVILAENRKDLEKSRDVYWFGMLYQQTFQIFPQSLLILYGNSSILSKTLSKLDKVIFFWFGDSIISIYIELIKSDKLRLGIKKREGNISNKSEILY